MQRNTTLLTGTQVADEAALKITRLQSGEIKPIDMGIDHLDDASMGGLLPGTVITLAGYSFHGKSYMLEQIQRHISKTHQDVVMLNCAWELEGFKTISRDLAYRTKKSVKDILFIEPTGEDLETFKSVFNSYRRPGLFFQPEPVAAEQFEEDLMYLIESYPNNRIVVCIDNLENILVDKGSQKECMDRMLYRINVLKKRHPFIAFIVLNQMNNDYPKRVGNIKEHVPLASDLYSTGQLFKLSDVVVFKIMPTRFGIHDKFMVFGKEMYPHLDSFKLPKSGAVTSFDPIGKIFYFYLKSREVDKDFQTVYAEEMYTRADIGMSPPSNVSEVPKFDIEKKEVPTVPIKPITPAIKNARSEF